MNNYNMSDPIPEHAQKKEESPHHEYIVEQKKQLLEKFAEDSEARQSIEAAIGFLEAGDAQFHEEVGYHGPEHVLSMARFAVQITENAEFQKILNKLNLDEAKKRSFKKCIAIAAILHDMGYYDNKNENSFGTRKVGHEDRSIQFVVENRDELKLSQEEVVMVEAMIASTIFGKAKKLMPLNDINLNAGEAGGTILGVLDILGADDNYLRNVAIGLHNEFKNDYIILFSKVPTNTEEYNQNKLQSDPVIEEYEKLKISLADNGQKQVQNSKNFFEYICKKRISDTGLITITVKENKVSMTSEYVPEEILEITRNNWQKVYDYFMDAVKVPEEIIGIE